MRLRGRRRPVPECGVWLRAVIPEILTWMPRYFFNIRTKHALIPDLEGGEFPDVAAALTEAGEDARHMMAELVRNGGEIDGRKFDITDEQGTIVASLAFRDAVKSSDDAEFG
jgi:hypothetical protein